MARPKRTKPPRLMTQVELELMTHLWELGEATVREIAQRLPPGRDLAYTSVATMMRVLEGKRMVRSERRGRAHVFRPRIAKGVYQSRSVKDLVERVFDGMPTALVARLLDDDGLSREDLERIVNDRLGAERDR